MTKPRVGQWWQSGPCLAYGSTSIGHFVFHFVAVVFVGGQFFDGLDGTDGCDCGWFFGDFLP